MCMIYLIYGVETKDIPADTLDKVIEEYDEKEGLVWAGEEGYQVFGIKAAEMDINYPPYSLAVKGPISRDAEIEQTKTLSRALSGLGLTQDDCQLYVVASH